VEKCWSTDITPGSGAYGDQSRIDDLNILPTLNGSTGLSYGSPSLNAESCTELPHTGGDYPWGGGDAPCGSHTCSYPAGVSCNYSPSQFTTQNYTDESGNWHFAMGGGSQCESNGKEVPCNLGHRMYPYDCKEKYSAKCVYTSPQDSPFNWNFPESNYFAMISNLYVGGASGPWHAFFCADIADTGTGGWLEVCDEPYNSTGFYEPTQISCAAGSKNFAILWQKAGATSSYMSAFGTDTNKSGQWIGEDWTMTRTQFINLLSAAHNQCGVPTDNYEMNHWDLYYTEQGMEEIGAAGYGAGINWETSNQSTSDNY
jgi:hypothetical protein